jgi:outer membrane protein OmpA-like peptidoglycan-associated protein
VEEKLNNTIEEKKMKKSILMLCCTALFAALVLPAAAIELAPDTAAGVPSVYAKVVGGKAVYDRQSTAYSPYTFNKIMEAYGLSLGQDSTGLPAAYTKNNKTSTAYEPAAYHSIFTAYGLELSPTEVDAKLGATDYAKVVNGKVVFGKSSTAYSGSGLATILSAYSLPMTAPAPAKAPAPAVDSDQDGVVDSKDKCPDTPAGAKIDDRGCWVLSAAYLFDFDKATIKTQYLGFLDDVIKVLNANPSLRIETQGHTDSVGSNAYNQGLSERRAKAVQAYLVQNGVDASRVTAVGLGEESPAYSNDTKDGQAKNRRVELNPIW